MDMKTFHLLCQVSSFSTHSSAVHVVCAALIRTWGVLSQITRCHFALIESDDFLTASSTTTLLTVNCNESVKAVKMTV